MGYYEGEEFEINWSFNRKPEHNLIVEYGDAQGFIGDIKDAHLEEVGRSKI